MHGKAAKITDPPNVVIASLEERNRSDRDVLVSEIAHVLRQAKQGRDDIVPRPATLRRQPPDGYLLRSIPGSPCTISRTPIPEAIIRSITAAVIRVPRTVGCPRQIVGSTTMRSISITSLAQNGVSSLANASPSSTMTLTSMPLESSVCSRGGADDQPVSERQRTQHAGTLGAGRADRVLPVVPAELAADKLGQIPGNGNVLAHGGRHNGWEQPSVAQHPPQAGTHIQIKTHQSRNRIARQTEVQPFLEQSRRSAVCPVAGPPARTGAACAARPWRL